MNGWPKKSQADRSHDNQVLPQSRRMAKAIRKRVAKHLSSEALLE